MAQSFHRDDNGVPLHGPEGLRPVMLNVNVATGAAIAELDISSLVTAANLSEKNTGTLRLINIGANPAFFSLGPAATAPANAGFMLRIQANSQLWMKVTKQDVSLYHQQITGSVTLEASIWV